MEYCKLCRRKHRNDKTMYKIVGPVTANTVAEFALHQVRKHGLVDMKVFPGEAPLSPETLIKVLNQKLYSSRKEKKKLKTKMRLEIF